MFVRSTSYVSIGDPCPICKIDLTRDTPPRMLPCGHGFHNPCLSAWEVHQPNDRALCCLCKEPYRPPVPWSERFRPLREWSGRVSWLAVAGCAFATLAYALRSVGSAYSYCVREDNSHVTLDLLGGIAFAAMGALFAFHLTRELRMYTETD